MQPNPFEFEAANKFTPEQMVDYFIDDDNLTRTVYSRKNVFLLGDRGTGKTMALRYYSLPVQYCESDRVQRPRDALLKHIGVYIPCRNPALAKTEPELLDGFLGRLMSEHLLVTAMVSALADSLDVIPGLVAEDEVETIRKEVNFTLVWELPEVPSIFRALKLAAERESRNAQRALNRKTPDSHYEDAATFATVFQPLVDILVSNVAQLRESHFSLMFDDAEDLTDYQNATLNTWIATRDASRISFKVATSRVDQKPLITVTGSGLLEKHDFIRVDLEKDFQNSQTDYGQLARKIVNRRLEKFGIEVKADKFFPINPQMAADLEDAESETRREAEKKYTDAKQIRDYVHKRSRAMYFRNRPPQANLPPYSGFDLLVHVSTGVIRYLLEPCFTMYDKALSSAKEKSAILTEIPPAIQSESLEVLSKRRWEWLKDGFNNSIKGCTREDARRIGQLIDQIAVLFKHRLLTHQSEPRAISFSISAQKNSSDSQLSDLERLLKIARRAQLLFVRTSTAKIEGRQDEYYTFDRLLWIDRGLDPVGQNARVSIEARFLWQAAFENKSLPTSPVEKSAREEDSDGQLDISFDGDK